MKIETISGKIVDTDKLSDKEAEIYEAINNAYQVCERYNVAMILRVVTDEKGFVLGANRMFEGDASIRAEYVNYMINEIDEYLRNSTGGLVGVMPLVEPED